MKNVFVYSSPQEAFEAGEAFAKKHPKLAAGRVRYRNAELFSGRIEAAEGDVVVVTPKAEKVAEAHKEAKDVEVVELKGTTNRSSKAKAPAKSKDDE